MNKIAFDAVGCKLNQYEIQAIAEAIEPYGFRRVPFNQFADIYVVNTCTVTARADSDSRNSVGRALRNNPQAKIIATGCLAQLRPEVFAELGENIMVAGNSLKNELPRLVVEMFSGQWKNNESVPCINKMEGHSRAFVKIQDGCSERCSYCTIWMARGKSHSRPMQEIIDEINRLYRNGYREAVLTGVHIGLYRNGATLIELLENIINNTPMPRLRLSSLKPDEIDQQLVEFVRHQSRICPHFHLSIQSGSDRILRIMGRKYGSDQVKRSIDDLVDARPDATISADFIVGFPGESDCDFEATRDLVRQQAIHKLHVFSYSDRPGTVASNLPDKISPKLIRQRHDELERIGRRKWSEHISNFVGSELDVIVENLSPDGIAGGTSGNYIKVRFQAERIKKGELVDIRVVGIDKNTLHGEIVPANMTKK